MTKDSKGRGEFRTISLPAPLIEKVEEIIEKFEYWPTKTDFIREAVLDKLEKYNREHKIIEDLTIKKLEK